MPGRLWDTLQELIEAKKVQGEWPMARDHWKTHKSTPPNNILRPVVRHKTTKNRSFSLFSFPDFAGYYCFEYRSLRQDYKSEDPFRNVHNRDA
jgi:hypothetical protein